MRGGRYLLYSTACIAGSGIADELTPAPRSTPSNYSSHILLIQIVVAFFFFAAGHVVVGQFTKQETANFRPR